MLENLPVDLKIFRMMAHAETAFLPLLRLGTAILSQQQLDPKLREFAVLQAAYHTPGRYGLLRRARVAGRALQRPFTEARWKETSRPPIGGRLR